MRLYVVQIETEDSQYSIIIHFNHFIRRYRTSTRIILSTWLLCTTTRDFK